MKWLSLAWLLFSLLGFSQFGWAKIQITESVTQFRFPNFSPNGFIEWVLEGQSGRLEDGLLDIEALLVRMYSSDRYNRQLGTVRGENCKLDTESSIARSDATIQIEGSGFNLSGRDWSYNLKSKTIEIATESAVRFSESIGYMFSEMASGVGGTQIKSDSLRLVIEPHRYRFSFMGRVHLTSDSIDLQTDNLVIDLLNASEKVEFSIPSGELSGLDRVEASGSVRFNSPEYKLRSSSLYLNPKKEQALFDGDAVIEISQAQLMGDRIEFNRGQLALESFENRLASFSLNGPVPDSVDSSNLASETFIQSERIYFERESDRYTYRFKDRVFFQGQGYRIYSDQLTAETNALPTVNGNSIFQELLHAHAEGSVKLKAETFNIRSQTLDLLPKENRLKASESVYYESEFAQLSSDELLVKNNFVRAESHSGLLSVRLPETLDFGFKLNNTLDDLARGDGAAMNIQSQVFYLEKEGEYLNSRFSDAVHVEQYSADLVSDQLEILWQKGAAHENGIVQTDFVIETIVAKGSVVMTQADFSASADQLSILPKEEQVSLYGEGGGAQFKDSNGTVYGERIDYNRRLKQTVVSGKGGASRARIQFDLFEGTEDNLEENIN